VPEHAELSWLLASVTPVGDLNRMHQFRDKSVAQRELVSAGLLFYPVLQAADVLAYRAHEVPVGEDQREHLELMRDIAVRFNRRFGEVLIVPEARIPQVGARIRDLQDPTRKMSTTGATEQGTVYVLDEPAAILKKFKRAVTDSGTEIVRAGDKPGISNLIELFSVVRSTSPEDVEREFAGARYGDFKVAVGEAVAELLAPTRDRYQALRAHERELEETLAAGAERARAMAVETLADVRERMGVGPARSVGPGA
jgi:tryptophanyl-tRNA synthetase